MMPTNSREKKKKRITATMSSKSRICQSKTPLFPIPRYLSRITAAGTRLGDIVDVKDSAESQRKGEGAQNRSCSVVSAASLNDSLSFFLFFFYPPNWALRRGFTDEAC